jgi:hypothetical protein
LLNLADFLGRIEEVSAYDVVTSRHPYCAGPPRPRPDGYDHHHFVALVAEPGIESCLQWFAVDLYVNGNGQVLYVQAQVWER